MACRSCIEYDDRVLHWLYMPIEELINCRLLSMRFSLLHDFRKPHCFIDPRDCKGKVLHHCTHQTILISLQEFSKHAFIVGWAHNAPLSLVKSSQGLSPLHIDWRSLSLELRLWRIFAQMHLKDYEQGLWTILRAYLNFWRRNINGPLTISSTDSRQDASWMANEQDVVVFPDYRYDKYILKSPWARNYRRRLYHLQKLLVAFQPKEVSAPQKIHFSVFWSITFCRVGECTSVAIDWFFCM